MNKRKILQVGPGCGDQKLAVKSIKMIRRKKKILFSPPFFLLLSFYAFYFSPTSGKLPWLKICFTQYFRIARRNIYNKHFSKLIFIFLRKKLIFASFFYTASVWSWSLDQPLVPGVLNYYFLSFYIIPYSCHSQTIFCFKGVSA